MDTHVAFTRTEVPRADVAALLERLAHNVRAGIVVGDAEAIPLGEEMSVRVVVRTSGDGTHTAMTTELVSAG